VTAHSAPPIRIPALTLPLRGPTILRDMDAIARDATPDERTAPQGLPTGTVTLLFTDIEAST